MMRALPPLCEMFELLFGMPFWISIARLMFYSSLFEPFKSCTLSFKIGVVSSSCRPTECQALFCRWRRGPTSPPGKLDPWNSSRSSAIIELCRGPCSPGRGPLFCCDILWESAKDESCGDSRLLNTLNAPSSVCVCVSWPGNISLLEFELRFGSPFWLLGQPDYSSNSEFSSLVVLFMQRYNSIGLKQE